MNGLNLINLDCVFFKFIATFSCPNDVCIAFVTETGIYWRYTRIYHTVWPGKEWYALLIAVHGRTNHQYKYCDLIEIKNRDEYENWVSTVEDGSRNFKILSGVKLLITARFSQADKSPSYAATTNMPYDEALYIISI